MSKNINTFYMKALLEQVRAQLMEIESKRQKDAINVQNVPLFYSTPLTGHYNPASVFLGRYNGYSRTTHESRLRQLARYLDAPDENYEWLNWASFTVVRVERLAAELQTVPINPPENIALRSFHTINNILSTLKGVLHETLLMGMISVEHYERVNRIGVFNKYKNKIDPPLKIEYTVVFEDLCDETEASNHVKAARDRAIFRLAFLAGVRREELTRLERQHLDLDNAIICVCGKRGTFKYIEISDQIVSALEAWFTFRGELNGPLFYRISQTGKIIANNTDKKTRGLSPEGVRYLFKHYSEMAGLTRNVTPRDARSDFCMSMMSLESIDPAAAIELSRYGSLPPPPLVSRLTSQKRQQAMNDLTLNKFNPKH